MRRALLSSTHLSGQDVYKIQSCGIAQSLLDVECWRALVLFIQKYEREWVQDRFVQLLGSYLHLTVAQVLEPKRQSIAHSKMWKTVQKEGFFYAMLTQYQQETSGRESSVGYRLSVGLDPCAPDTLLVSAPRFQKLGVHLLQGGEDPFVVRFLQALSESQKRVKVPNGTLRERVFLEHFGKPSTDFFWRISTQGQERSRDWKIPPSALICIWHWREQRIEHFAKQLSARLQKHLIANGVHLGVNEHPEAQKRIRQSCQEVACLLEHCPNDACAIALVQERWRILYESLLLELSVRSTMVSPSLGGQRL